MKKREYTWGQITFGQVNSAVLGSLLTLKLSHLVAWSWWIIALPIEWPIVLLVASLSLIVLVKAYRENA